MLNDIFDKEERNNNSPKLFFINPKELPNPDTNFKQAFNKKIDTCEFDEQTVAGILFYLGTTIPTNLGSDLFIKDKSNFLKIISLYSKSSGDFSDYGELSDSSFNYWIYNINYIINRITKNERSLNYYLRKIKLPSGKEMVIGETELDEEFINTFSNISFNLNACQNILDSFFKNLGKELLDKSVNRQRAYEAGFAYRMMCMNMDAQGMEYMLKSINKIFTPLYQSIFYLPELYIFNNHAFKSNHLFSNILNNFYGGQNSTLFEFAEAIHRYHQYTFYKPNSIEIRDEWPFAKITDDGSSIMLFIKALQIKNVKFDKDFSTIVKNSGELFDSSIINKNISIDEFVNIILRVIYNKYGVEGQYEFTLEGNKNGDWLDDGKWNHKGDYIQFLVLLWYETCLHSLALNNISE